MEDRKIDIQPVKRRSYFYYGLIFLLAMGLSGLTANFVLERFPNSSDEYAYLFQAETYKAGRFWNPVHPKQDFFYIVHVIEKEGKWYGAYGPGWPLVLCLGMLLKIPAWLINPFLAGLYLLFLFKFTERSYNTKTASGVVLSLLFCPFFIFNAASYFSHILCVLEILLGVYFFGLFLETKKAIHIGSGSFFFALGMLTRSYTTFWCLLPVIIFWIKEQKRQVVRSMGWIFFGALPIAVIWSICNFKITGNPFIDVTISSAGYTQSIQFLAGYHFKDMAASLKEHVFQLTKWTSPGLVCIYAFSFIRNVQSKKYCVFDFIFPSVVLGFFLFPLDAGTEYGPRYYYEAYPFLVLSAAGSLFGNRMEFQGRHTREIFQADKKFAVGLVFTAAWDFWLHLVRRGKIFYIPRPLTYYRLHRSAYTLQCSRYPREFKRQLRVVFRKHYAALIASHWRRKKTYKESSLLFNRLECLFSISIPWVRNSIRRNFFSSIKIFYLFEARWLGHVC
ncbi:MAG: hypothetical protein EXS63_09080 [Candidatus Omnitrophica bacterium]|nr:hypothetical protein [Candidatus Omnitrophota bacterium]